MADENWIVVFHPDFAPEFRVLDDSVKVALGALFDKLRDRGPALARPFADTLNGSRHANMKELRFGLDDDWYRFAYAFDPKQKVVVLCGGGKGGVSQARFHDALIAKADRRYEHWIEGDR